MGPAGSGRAYTSDLSPLIGEGAADFWIYGHTHESRDFTAGTTRIVTNSKGYGPWLPKEKHWDNETFDPCFTLEIPRSRH